MLLGQVEQTELWDLAEEAAGLSPSCHRLGGRHRCRDAPPPASQLGPQLRAFRSHRSLLFVVLSQETPSLLLLQDAHGPPPALLFSCQTGVGRASLGMVLGTLLLFRRGGAALRPE